MVGYRMEPMDGERWPGGCYEASPEGTLRLVVISQLPRARDTVVVRTLGRGRTFEEAMEDLDALPLDAPERTLVGPLLVSLRLQMQNDPTDEAQAMITQSQKIYEKFRREVRKEGALGALREALADVCNARSLKLTAVQRTKLASEADVVTLRRWLTRAASATRAAEVFAAAR